MMMLRNLIKTPNYISNLSSRTQVPKRFKSTMVHKWADYWKNLFIDYRQMLQDLRTDIQEDPRRAMMWAGGLSTVYALAKNNPDELDYRDYLKQIKNEVFLVSDDCRKPSAADHVRFVETCYNRGVIHYANLGIASIMYVTDMTEGCDLYKSKCSYLQPSYFTMPSRIVDIGIMGRWWNIFIKTTNYDINM